ncbi:MAG TPA: VOC family protein [Acidisoma sp.]|uniref:VOC family protein n=1 Tax=Acidisoma sp. TaxID=1872115 RepID=UPI002BD2B426|nr:VOC family protein [Acidisoma sp.]HTH99373.1 VOC family protein [Acidisoma sp.]
MTIFASTRLITGDIRRLVDFYALVTGIAPSWPAPVFAEFLTARATLAIGAAETMALFGTPPARPGENHCAIVEFRVADVDREAARLAAAGIALVQEPTTMPWGNRSLLLRDPDGNLVNLFAPVTPEAIARFAGR